MSGEVFLRVANVLVMNRGEDNVVSRVSPPCCSMSTCIPGCIAQRGIETEL